MSEDRDPTDPTSEADPRVDGAGESALHDAFAASDEARSDGADGDTSGPPPEATLPTDDELSRAAREAQAGPYIPGGHFKPPDTIKILVLVVACIAGFLLYFVIWIQSSIERSDRIRLRTLEQKTFDYEKQQRSFRATGYLPAGKTHPKLTRDEQGELAGLREKYGPIRIIDPDAPTTTPTTAPAPQASTFPPATAPAGP